MDLGTDRDQMLIVQAYVFVWCRKLYFPVDSTRAEEGGVQDVNSIGRHHYFDVLSGLKAIQLVEEF